MSCSDRRIFPHQYLKRFLHAPGLAGLAGEEAATTAFLFYLLPQYDQKQQPNLVRGFDKVQSATRLALSKTLHVANMIIDRAMTVPAMYQRLKVALALAADLMLGSPNPIVG